jgi:lipopolysaccharide export system protein LptC
MGNMIVGIVILLVVILCAAAFLLRKSNGNKKIIQMNRPRKSLGSKQSCSYCKRKVETLSFYSDGRGKVIGVCNVCKPHAERQALMRI